MWLPVLFLFTYSNQKLTSEADGNMKIDLKELPVLSLRLSMHLEQLGIELDMGMFEDMIREDNGKSSCIFLFSAAETLH